MKSKDVFMLFLLAALWGASFLFIRIGVAVLGPLVLVFLRVSIASLALLIYVAVRHKRLDVARKWKQYLLLGLLNAALPFSLISTAELHLSASLAAILNATTPLFTALVTWVWLKDTLTVKKIFGLILGLLGVAVLVGWDPHHSGDRLFISASYSLLGALSYAFAGVYSSRVFRGERPMDMAIGQQLGASAMMLPLAGAAIPHAPLSTVVFLAVLGLAVFCTAFAYLLYFALMRSVGPVKTLSVTFLIPVFGSVWGALILHENISANVVLGLTIVLLSVVMVGNLSLRRNRQGVKTEVPSVK